MKKFWYYRPFRFMQWKPVSHGSCEGNRCTVVIGNPLIGHLVIPRKRVMCFTYDAEARVGYVCLRVSGDGEAVSLRTEEVAPGVNIDFSVDTGEVFGIEILNYNGTEKTP